MMEPRWKKAKPGIERAECVMRPFRQRDGYVYLRARTMGYGNYEIPGTDGETFRIVSSERVEHAVETHEFLAICADEGLFVGFSDEGWQVMTGDTALDAPPCKTLRGAYVSHHKAVSCG